MVTFNISRYKQLQQLVKEKYLENKDIEFLTDPTYIELLRLQASIEIQLNYNHKDDYFALIQKYLDENGNPNTFRATFLKMAEKDGDECIAILNNREELSTFWMDSKAEKFGSVFDNINDMCRCIYEGEDEMSDTAFRDSIQKYFFELQKCLDEE